MSILDENFEPTSDQELDWAIHNDHQGDADDGHADGEAAMHDAEPFSRVQIAALLIFDVPISDLPHEDRSDGQRAWQTADIISRAREMYDDAIDQNGGLDVRVSGVHCQNPLQNARVYGITKLDLGELVSVESLDIMEGVPERAFATDEAQATPPAASVVITRPRTRAPLDNLLADLYQYVEQRESDGISPDSELLDRIVTARVDLSRKDETAIDFAHSIGFMMAKRRHFANDSREVVRLIQAAVENFEAAHVKTDWETADYLTLVDEAADQLYTQMIGAGVFQ